MKTIRIAFQPSWINEERKKELERSIADIPYIESFSFTKDDYLEVTIPKVQDPIFVMNLCSLKIQYAIRASALY